MPRQSKYLETRKTNTEYLYKAALYIRLSVEDGDKEESNSVSNQRKNIRIEKHIDNEKERIIWEK